MKKPIQIRPIFLTLLVIILVIYHPRNENLPDKRLHTATAPENEANEADDNEALIEKASPLDENSGNPPVYRPDFMLSDLSGVMRNVSEWQGKILIVNFWATWCPPCVREMPMFVEAQKTFKSQGVQFVGIAIDSPDKVRTFAQEFSANYPLLVGDQEATIEVAYQFGNDIGILPYTVVVNPLGEIVYSNMGEMSRVMVVKAIALALESTDPAYKKHAATATR